MTAYVVFRTGHTVHPFAILLASVTIAAATFWLWRGTDIVEGRENDDKRSLVASIAVVLAIFAWLMYLGWPELLPIGGGPDLAHHMVLVGYIEQYWRLARDITNDPYLGDMVYYTPGAHLLIALTGAWTRTDGLHVLHSVMAMAVAVKAGFVFLIAHRLLRDDVPRLAIACASVLLLFVPQSYFLGSFIGYTFLSQVIAELFAVAAWWTLVMWEDRPSTGAMLLFAAAGMATFVTWPIWIGPVTIALAAVVLTRNGLPWTTRIRHLLIAGVPIAAIVALHVIGRLEWLRYAATAGDAPWPSIGSVGPSFMVLAAVGLVSMTRQPRRRASGVLLAAILVQAVALAIVATRGGADRPYLALKMMYLAIYPLAVAAALGLAAIWRASRLRDPRIAWSFIAIAVIAIGIRRPPAPRIVNEPMFLAGVWARDHVSPACVDYLTADSNAALWLHVAVLRNLRTNPRTDDPATFEWKDAVVRWIYPSGLPYAIVEDFSALPRDIRESVDVAARFGRAAVIKRRGPSVCDQS